MSNERKHAGMIAVGFRQHDDYRKLKEIMPEIDNYAVNIAKDKSHIPDGQAVYLTDMVANNGNKDVPYMAKVVFDGMDATDVKKAFADKFSQYRIGALLSREAKPVTEEAFADVTRRFSNSASAADDNPEPPVLARDYPERSGEGLDALLRRVTAERESEVKLNESLLPRDDVASVEDRCFE